MNPSASPPTLPTSPPSDPNSIQSWWESISKARTRIHALSPLLPSSSTLSSLADSDRPAKALLENQETFIAISIVLSKPTSGSNTDPLCQWLYETFQTSDPDLHSVVLSFIPLISGLYLSRVINSPDSQVGFEALLLAIYGVETRARGGKSMLVNIPDLSQASLYHSPRNPDPNSQNSVRIGVLSAALEPQMAVKSTKRGCIVGVALDLFYRKISIIPWWAKIDLCEFVGGWAGQNCPCRFEFDQEDGFSGGGGFSGEENGSVDNEINNVGEEMERRLRIGNGSCSGVDGCFGEDGVGMKKVKGARIPLPWELLQPVLRILGHCLLAPSNPQEVRDAASVAVRCLYARVSHDLVPQAILATRSLIQLDNGARLAAKAAAAAAHAAMNVSTPTKPKKPEILLVSR